MSSDEEEKFISQKPKPKEMMIETSSRKQIQKQSNSWTKEYNRREKSSKKISPKMKVKELSMR